MGKTYQKMSKEEKKQLKAKYSSLPEKKELNTRLLRLFILGILGIIAAVFIIIYNIKTKAGWWEYVSSASLLVAAIVFIFSSIRIYYKELEKFAAKRVIENETSPN